MGKNIIVYSSKGCDYCKQVIDFFQGEEIEVDERNVSESQEHFKEWKEINPLGTPLTCYEDNIVIGFHKKKLGLIVEKYHKT